MAVGIVGVGHVGTAMQALFPNAAVYDKYRQLGSKESVNACQCVFVCVPTPKGEDGRCDTSAVDEVLGWVQAGLVVIRSTVPVGYTAAKAKELGKDIVFQPEYYGETVDHPFTDLSARRWITLGGTREARQKAVSVYQTVYNSDVFFQLVDAETAELAKYMENAFLATKVTFCNEFYDLAQSFGVDYNELRETWLCDPRIGRSHTFVYEQDRGYEGSCLPKDMASILYQAKMVGVDTTLLSSVQKKNRRYRVEGE